MKHGKFMKAGLALVLITTAGHASALTTKAGLDACAAAMVKDLSKNQGSAINYSMDPESKGGNGRLSGTSLFHLDARSADGNEVVARMDCEVNNKAEVVRLITVPLKAKDAIDRATTFNWE